jgi:signal peptidase II
LKLKFDSKWITFSAITVLGLAIDLYTKYCAVANLRMGIPVRIAGDYAQLLLVYNKAAVFGLDPRRLMPAFPVNTFFTVFSIIAIVLVTLYFRTLKRDDVLLRYGICLVMPGALGNLFDRIIHPQSGVVDFVRLGISETLYWPVFNMADVYVTFGVILIFISFLFEGGNRKSPEKSNPPQTTE